MKRCLATLLLVSLSLLLAGCGGGGGTVAEGGIGGTGISMGRVSQLGSVYVNGIHYNTDSTRFVIDGDDTGTLSDISVGMVVRVDGTRDLATATGVADVVTYDSLLIGPVDTVFDTTTSHLGVMGQAVHINQDTVFEDLVNPMPIEIGSLLAGDLVEVSGFVSSPGEILATRISLRSSASHYRVSGVATHINTLTSHFEIGTLTIDALADAANLPAEGALVSATGAHPPTGNTLVADSISPVESGSLAGDGEELSIEGVITVGLDVTTHLFQVNDLVVDASLTPYASDDLTLTVGRVVEVDGVMNDTVLLAETIEPEASSSEREEISALIESGAVNLAGNTITLMGQTIHVTNSTIFENDRDGESTFTLADLQVGDYLEAKVYDNNGEITATKLELEDNPSSYDARLEGIPSELSPANRIEILGVTIDTSGIAGYTFEARPIEVRGIYNTGTGVLSATSISNAN